MIFCQLSRCSITSRSKMTSYLDLRFSLSIFDRIYLILSPSLIECFFAISIFFFTKSNPEIFIPILANGSQTRPPPHPISIILILLYYKFVYIVIIVFTVFQKCSHCNLQDYQLSKKLKRMFM